MVDDVTPPQDDKPGDGKASDAPDTAGAGDRPRPEYGGLASDYPGWDPYVYGAPEKERKTHHLSNRTTQYGAGGAASGANQDKGRDEGRENGEANPGTPPVTGPWDPAFWQGAGQDSAGGPGGAGGSGGRGAQGGMPSDPWGMYDFKADDPRRNPVYNAWDPMAIVAIFFAFLMPYIGLPLGLISLYRTNALHMRGKGLAVASIIVSVLLIAFSVYLVNSGMYEQMRQALQQMYGYGPTPGPSGTATPDPSASATTHVYTT